MSTAQERVAQLETLRRVGLALSAEKDRDRLFEMILVEAKELCHADGATLYLRTDDDNLRFTIVRTDSLGIKLGGTTGHPVHLPDVPLYDAKTGDPNERNVVSYAALVRKSVNLQDAYHTQSFDFSGTKKFDRLYGYHSKSFLTIPMVDNDDQVIGVLQFINAIDPSTGEVTAFDAEKQRLVETLASQAAVALHNRVLLEEQEHLLESFIKLLASAIDAKSPYTGAHCERVPVLAEMLADELCASKVPSVESFHLTDEQRQEFRIAAWLHDCGKVVTPIHIMDKATKLERIMDGMEVVRLRWAVMEKDIELDYLKNVAAHPEKQQELQTRRREQLQTLGEQLAFLERCNIGGEFMRDEDIARVREIGAMLYEQDGQRRPVLSEQEIDHLCIRRGTLSADERLTIEAHMVHTIDMLRSLPFPRHLSQVPEWAGSHHERLDGSGYPRGLYADDLSIPARLLAIADVFEALTAQDRPYKRGKTLSEAMKIMGEMKRHNHLDPDLFDVFVTSGVYRAYAQKYLKAEQCDEVDEDMLLAIEPLPYEVPSEEERRSRREQFLAKYRRAGGAIRL